MLFHKKILHLSLISLILMFLELLLVRLIGTEIRIFAYVPNLVLLTVFIGSGTGMFMKRNIPLTVSIFCIMVLTGILVTNTFLGITQLLAPISDSYIWSFGEPTAPLSQILKGLAQLLLLLLLITTIFIPIGRYISELFGTGKQASFSYAVHIFFSIVGMWIFFGLSSASVSPYVGILISQCLLLVLIPKKHLLFPIALSGTTLLLTTYTLLPKNNAVWSPYQKLNISPIVENDSQHKYIIRVNNVGFMVLTDLSRESRIHSIEKAMKTTDVSKADMKFMDSYMLPYIMKPSSRDVLIIGAGGGNDAAAALRAGVPNITAVEIDPNVIQLGALYHPEHPYTDSRVKVVNDDGRSYIKKTEKKYDIVILGFADSHTTNSNMTNIQLDNYLYTLESYRDIKKILKPNGILFLSFSIPRQWIGGHIQRTLAEAFHQKPIIFTIENDATCLAGCDGTFFVAALDRNQFEQDISPISGLIRFTYDRTVDYPEKTPILRDDWPYLYLSDKQIPNLHIITALMTMVIFIFLGKKVLLFSHILWTPFFLGAAFLLYEFQNITKTSLLFGNTWIVNVYAITATLVMGFIATLVYTKFKVPLTVSYAGLFLSLCLELLVPLASFNQMGFGLRLGITSIALYIPAFFSGLVFITAFSQTKREKIFLGSNLVGSFFGGILCLLSYIFGLHALLYAVLGLYALSMITTYGKFKIVQR